MGHFISIRGGLALLGLFSSSAAAAGAPEAAGSVDISSLVRLIIGLGVVIAAIIGLAWFLRRLGSVGHTVGGQLRVLGGLTVGQRERVVLVQVGEKQLLLGVAPGRVQTLHILEQPLEGLPGPQGPRQAEDGSFAERLRRAMQQQREKR